MSQTSKFKKLTGSQIFAVHGEILKNAIIENGVVTYHPGWDDGRVAAAAIPDYPGDSRTAVSAYRLRNFGTLAAKPPGDIEALRQDVDKLRVEVAEMRALLADRGLRLEAA